MMLSILSPASASPFTCSGDERAENLLLRRCCVRFHSAVRRRAELACELSVHLTRITIRARGDLRGEQRSDDAVLVRRPRLAIATQKRRTRALFAAKAQLARREPLGEPLEAHRHLVQPPRELPAHAIDHRAADDGLSDRQHPRATAADARKRW